MASIFYIIAIYLMLNMDVCLPTESNCQVNFTVQENFNLEKYLGKWYEIKWQAPFHVSAESRYDDYTHTYSLESSNRVVGQVTARTQSTGCRYYKVYLNTTTDPGKLIYIQKTAAPQMYYVVKTDYINYAVAYGCYVQYDNGTCGRDRVWIWSRKPTISDQHLQEANTVVESLCFSVSSLISTLHTEECKEQDTSGGSTIQLKLPTFIFTSVIVLITLYK